MGGLRCYAHIVLTSSRKLYFEVAWDLLKKFPDISYNLDLGHLNVGIENKKFGYGLDEFLKKIDKKQSMYMHIIIMVLIHTKH